MTLKVFGQERDGQLGLFYFLSLFPMLEGKPKLAPCVYSKFVHSQIEAINDSTISEKSTWYCSLLPRLDRNPELSLCMSKWSDVVTGKRGLEYVRSW